MISKKILNNLEYDKVLNNVAKELILSMSANKLVLSTPAKTYDEALHLQNLAKEGEIILYHYNRSPLENFDDVEDVLNRAKVNSLLSFSDLKRVGFLLRSSRIFLISIRDIGEDEIPLFKNLSLNIYENYQFEQLISETFISDEEIADNASPELAIIRKKIRQMNRDIKDRLNNIIRNKDVQKYLQDNIITSRDGRFVIPVKSDCKGRINGLIHDYSASGSTIYVEPIEIVEINNELRMLILSERAEIERILQSFTDRVSKIVEQLFYNQELLVDFDIILAKVKYGKISKGIIPALTIDGSFNIIGGRHPLLKDVVVVPVTINISKGKNYLLISGPNTGGKTVAMKMVGLFALMAMSGMYIQAKEGSSISFYQKVFSDIGDEQSIEQNLSTFSSHIKTLKEIIDSVDENSLVLLDEIGSGTDPQEGSALALSVLEYLLDKGSKGIITTHYSELKEFTYTTDKMINASMEFDMNTLTPTYKLNIGTPGTSKALDIASRLGLNINIIDNARKRISSSKISFDEIINRAENERLIAEKLKIEYEEMNKSIKEKLAIIENEKEKAIKERENATKLAKIEAKRIVLDAQEEAEELVGKIKEIYNKADNVDGKDVIEASKTKNKISDIVDINEDSFNNNMFEEFSYDKIKTNDNIFVKSLSSICKIIEINIKKKEVVVLFGNMKIKAKENDLLIIKNEYKSHFNKKEENNNRFIKKTSNVKIVNNIKSELNIVGMRAFEAEKEVELFLDNAAMGSLDEVKIIHGVGTLTLKNLVAEILSRTKYVKSFRSGQFGEGEMGVTIVELKK